MWIGVTKFSSKMSWKPDVPNGNLLNLNLLAITGTIDSRNPVRELTRIQETVMKRMKAVEKD